MNLDSVPPVRPLLTHVIAAEPLRREAGINGAGQNLDKRKTREWAEWQELERPSNKMTQMSVIL